MDHTSISQYLLIFIYFSFCLILFDYYNLYVLIKWSMCSYNNYDSIHSISHLCLNTYLCQVVSHSYLYTLFLLNLIFYYLSIILHQSFLECSLFYHHITFWIYKPSNHYFHILTSLYINSLKNQKYYSNLHLWISYDCFHTISIS